MKGMYALRAGAHLVNKGCEVVVCLLGEGLVGSGGTASVSPGLEKTLCFFFWSMVVECT